MGSLGLSVPTVALAQNSKLKSDQIKKYDESFLAAEKSACDGAPVAGRGAWLAGELKKLGAPDPSTQGLSRQVWNAQTPSLKIDGVAQTAAWVRGSPGTFGTIAGIALNADKDKTTVTGPLTDVGEGTVSDLNSASKIASGTFWLVEMGDAIPAERALAIEAKNRGALGLILYGATPADLNLESGGVAALPMITVDDKVAKDLKIKLKAAPVNVALSLKTDYPVNETGQALLVKKGARDEQVYVIAGADRCDEVSEALAVLKWMTDSNVDVVGTTFAFVDGQDFIDHVEDWAHAVTSIVIETTGTSVGAKFLSAWYKADQNPESSIDIKSVLKKAEDLHNVLKGLISGEDLRKYQDDLVSIEKPAAVSKPMVKAKLVQLYTPSGQDSFVQIANELKKLREIHELAEKGLYDRAAAELKQVSDFRWADNVSPETFLAYEKQRDGDVAALDPALWVESRKGKDGLDALIVVLEKEIDRLDKILSDNFFKLQKSIEQFRNI